MPSTGKEIFENLVEYPLPERAGVRDYIFYFVSASDKYGKAARKFFNQYYGKHKSLEVKSLEGLISELHKEIKSGVNQIREIIIVCHGNQIALQLHLTEDVNTDAEPPRNEHYRYLTDNSLAILQDEFLTNKRKEFNDKRKEVVSKLTGDSWVTIRACRFGVFTQGMYAFYSFFGGNANLFAPRIYQMFGYSPVTGGMKFESRFDFYQHLIKQRLLPQPALSLRRRDIILNQFIEPGRFRQPFVIAQQNVVNPISEEMLRYETVIDELNKGKINTIVKDKFKNEGMELSQHTMVKKIKIKNVTNNKIILVDNAWSFNDKITGPDNIEYAVEYKIIEELENLRKMALIVYAKLADMHTAYPSVNFQSFFDEEDHRQFNGFLFELHHYMENNKDKTDENAFKNIVNLLNRGIFFEGSMNLKSLFSEHLKTLLDDPQARLSDSATITKNNEGWIIKDDTASYLVEADFYYSIEDSSRFQLLVYIYLDAESQLRAKNEAMAHLGKDVDSPGTELMAYLYKYSYEELRDFIKHLNKLNKPETTIYSEHAFECMISRRKVELIDEDVDSPLGLQTYLSDRKGLYYETNAHDIWKEVKTTNPHIKPFVQDSFLELKLLNLSGVDPKKSIFKSPFTSIDELKTFEASRYIEFDGIGKGMYSPEEEENRLSCDEFQQILDLIKQRKIAPFDLEKLLEDIFNDKNLDKTFVDKIIEIGKKAKKVYDYTKGLHSKITTIVRYSTHPGTVINVYKGHFTKLFRRLPFLTKAGHVAGSIGGTLIIELFVLGYKMMAANVELIKAWNARARIVGARQAAKALQSLAKDSLKDSVAVVVPGGRINLWVPSYDVGEFNESEDKSTNFPLFGDYEKNYLEAVKAIEDQATDTFHKLDEIINDLLWSDGGLSTCQIMKIRESGLINFDALKATIMLEFANKILEEVFIGTKRPTQP